MNISYCLKTLLILSLLGLSACDERSGLTAESAYIAPIWQTPPYRFTRHGSSSVDTRQPELVQQGLDILYNSYLREARIMSEATRREVQTYFTRGYHQGYSLQDGIAQSSMHQDKRTFILSQLQNLLSNSAELSGFGSTEPNRKRNTAIAPLQSGYIGVSIGDKNIAFANNRGLVVAEVFRYYAMGAYYLDKLYNIHTHDTVIHSQELQERHQNNQLVLGQNYTELEQHWDLAFGYFLLWRKVIQSEGSPLLKGREQRIYDAFAQARFDLSLYDSASLGKHRKIIYDELSRGIAIRAIYLLLGRNTQANLSEETPYAFHALSQAIGIIYSLPFILSPEGKPYFTHTEVQQLAESLLQGDGLWDTNRLLSGESTTGSLKQVASAIAKPFGIDIANI